MSAARKPRCWKASKAAAAWSAQNRRCPRTRACSAGSAVFAEGVVTAQQARFAMEFCRVASCGKCTPCRIGSTRGVETIDKIIRGERTAENLAVVEDLCNTMKFGSLCALGGFTPYPVLSALKHFREDFGPAPATLQAAE